MAWEGPADLCARVPRPIVGIILTIISRPLALSPAGWRLALPVCGRRLQGAAKAIARPCVHAPGESYSDVILRLAGSGEPRQGQNPVA